MLNYRHSQENVAEGAGRQQRSHFTVLTARTGTASLLLGTDGALMTDDRKRREHHAEQALSIASTQHMTGKLKPVVLASSSAQVWE